MIITMTHIDTACALLEINGFKILTDPTLDSAGKYYHHGFGAVSKKVGNPANQTLDLTHIDLVLLSHHRHKDNFDIKGKELALKAPKIISTKQAERALSNAQGLNVWDTAHIETDKIPNLRITAAPAQHRPSWLPEFFSGKVMGFIIEFEGQENGVIYISGDTVFFSGINEIASRYKVDVGIFHVGSAQFRYLSGWGRYTMNSKDLIKAVKVLNPNTVIPIHYKGWTHFKEAEAVLKAALTNDTSTEDKTIFLKSGEKTMLQ